MFALFDIFPCSADHEQDWQPYPVDPYSAICDDHTYILQLTTRQSYPVDLYSATRSGAVHNTWKINILTSSVPQVWGVMGVRLLEYNGVANNHKLGFVVKMKRRQSRCKKKKK